MPQSCWIISPSSRGPHQHFNFLHRGLGWLMWWWLGHEASRARKTHCVSGMLSLGSCQGWGWMVASIAVVRFDRFCRLAHVALTYANPKSADGSDIGFWPAAPPAGPASTPSASSAPCCCRATPSPPLAWAAAELPVVLCGTPTARPPSAPALTTIPITTTSSGPQNGPGHGMAGFPTAKSPSDYRTRQSSGVVVPLPPLACNV